MYFDDDDVDDHEVEDHDDEDDLNYFEPDDFNDPDDKYETYNEYERKNNRSEVLSLHDMCLTSISNNLPRFNLAFSTTEDSNLQRNLQFLQRFHSTYLIKAATRSLRKLNESYFDFLLNEYIKEFDMNILYKCDWDTVVKRISEIGHGFEKVRFNFPEAADFNKSIDYVNRVVRHLPNVKILDITPFCNDETLELIATSCLHLKELHIDDSSVTDKGLKSLCQENEGNMGRLNLKHLSLPGVIGVDEGIAYLLQNMPSLEVVVHPDLPYILYKMHKDSMNNTLERKYNLTSLYLGAKVSWEESTPSIFDFLILYIDICPHIKEVSLPHASQDHVNLCLRFPELESFHVNHHLSTNLEVDLNDFLKSKGGMLRRLHLEKCSLSAAVLLQNCPKLEKLDLQNIAFQSFEAGTSLQPLNNLQDLSLGYFTIGNDLARRSVIEILNSSRKIEKLTLLSCKFENNEDFVTKLSKFCENENLNYLKLTNCDVDDAFLQSVVLTCSNLKTLVVEYCDNITATHIENIYEIANSLKSQVKIIWTDDRSEFNSIDSGDDIFDDYSEYDSDDFDHDFYDSDNHLYYGYESDDF